MSELSGVLDPTASNRLQVGLQQVSRALSSTSLEVLAGAISKDDTQASRIRSGQLGITVTDAVRLLYASGLKVVSADRVCVDGPTYQAMATIASRAMANAEIAQKLTWDDQQ